MDSLDEFVEEIKGNDDTSLFAFIGHGIELKGKNYLVPCDAKLGERDYKGNERRLEEDLKQMCVPFSYVEETLAQVRNIKKKPAPSLFILDCCRDGCTSSGMSRAIIRDP